MTWRAVPARPYSLREHFEVLVSEFIFRPWKREHGGGLNDAEGGGVSSHRRERNLEDEGDEVLDEAGPGRFRS
jgi:DNA polymerase epsilon subunit 1